MNVSPERQRLIGRFAWVLAWVGLVLGQLHALARHNTVDGAKDLDLPLTRLWSDPARSLLKPLLDWADADTVYLTYGKIWFPVFLAFTLCALVVYRRRQSAGFEKVAWRITLTGYVLACVGVFLTYYTMWTGYLPASFADPMFFLSVIGLLISVIGSTLLGIALLRRHFRPSAPAWLLALSIPILLVVFQVTSMGSAALPWMFAFGILGHRMATERSFSAAAAPTEQRVAG
jgi:glucose uptake protein GlcU